jgi:hypothetical protein
MKLLFNMRYITYSLLILFLSLGGLSNSSTSAHLFLIFVLLVANVLCTWRNKRTFLANLNYASIILLFIKNSLMKLFLNILHITLKNLILLFQVYRVTIGWFPVVLEVDFCLGAIIGTLNVMNGPDLTEQHRNSHNLFEMVNDGLYRLQNHRIAEDPFTDLFPDTFFSEDLLPPQEKIYNNSEGQFADRFSSPREFKVSETQPYDFISEVTGSVGPQMNFYKRSLEFLHGFDPIKEEMFPEPACRQLMYDLRYKFRRMDLHRADYNKEMNDLADFSVIFRHQEDQCSEAARWLLLLAANGFKK